MPWFIPDDAIEITAFGDPCERYIWQSHGLVRFAACQYCGRPEDGEPRCLGCGAPLVICTDPAAWQRWVDQRTWNLNKAAEAGLRAYRQMKHDGLI